MKENVPYALYMLMIPLHYLNTILQISKRLLFHNFSISFIKTFSKISDGLAWSMNFEVK